LLAERVGDLDAAVVLAVAEVLGQDVRAAHRRDASMIAASQYESWKRWRASSAAIMIPLVMSWTGKRRNDWMSRTACRWPMASGRLARVAWT
jgi:hypothetical protein